MLTRRINVSGMTHTDRWFENQMCSLTRLWLKRRRHNSWSAEGAFVPGLPVAECSSVPLGGLVISICTEFFSTDPLYFEYVNRLSSFYSVFIYLWAISRVAGQSANTASALYLSRSLGRQSQKTEAGASCPPRELVVGKPKLH